MRITAQQLKRIIAEELGLDLEVGDVILTGKFKNKRKVVKDFSTDDLGQPTVNGMKVLTFRIEKLMPKNKWSKKSREALEFAEKVDEIKVTRKQLKTLISEVIRKLANGKYRLYSKKKNPKTGERRNLGTFDSRKAAVEREQQVQYFKHEGNTD